MWALHAPTLQPPSSQSAPGGLIQTPYDQAGPPLPLSQAPWGLSPHPRYPVTEGLPNCAYFTFLVFTDCAMAVVFFRAFVVMVHLPCDRRMVHW